MERRNPETRWVESQLVVYVLCVPAISDRCQTTSSCAHNEPMTNWAQPRCYGRQRLIWLVFYTVSLTLPT
jgi:hypothetical protein